MSWRDHVATTEKNVLPWLGGRRVTNGKRTWRVSGPLPAEHGWYEFSSAGGRDAKLEDPADPDPSYFEGKQTLRGYVVGDRFVPDNVNVDPDPNKLTDQAETVVLVEDGLERFARGRVVKVYDHLPLLYEGMEFPEGPELEVQVAFQDRADDVDHVKGVSPALELAFRWASYERARREAWQEEVRKRIEKEQLRRAAVRMVGTAAGRRELAKLDFEAAARAALLETNAQLLDVRKVKDGEMAVQYLHRERRLECVVDLELRVLDAGICLEDHATGQRGDRLFTLESLPAVVSQAMNEGRLVVWRHAPGDRGGRW